LIVPISIDSAQHAPKTDVPPQTQSIPPRNSLFHTIAMLLGVELFPKAPLNSRGGCSHTRQPPYETPIDILARRHPHLYICSLSG
jgi:hypothetical protein